jgi:hypothetical protein
MALISKSKRKKRKEQRKGILGGAVKGGIKGFMTGGFTGAAVGAAVGGKRGREEYKAKKAGREQEYANIGMARETVGSQFAASAQSREDVAKTFSSDVSSARARFAASGADLSSGSWDQQYGQLVLERENKLKELEASDESFRGSESYQLFKSDYEMAASNLTGASKAGTQILSKEQQGMLRTGDSGNKAYSEYTAMIAPSIGEYERGTFGTASEMAAYQTQLTERITAANSWYDTQMAANQYVDKNKNQFALGGAS